MVGTAVQPQRGCARTGFAAALTAAFTVLIAVAPSNGHAANSGSAEPEVRQSAADAPVQEIDDASEPFGRPTSELSEGPLADKWRAVWQSIDAELSLVSVCRLDLALCPSPAAIEFLAIVERARQRDGLAKLGEVNRAINLDVRPVADIEQYQVEDLWSSPLATLTSGAGDCEDYAIAKFVALREAGVPTSDLRLVILRDERLNGDHAVVAVRIDHRWRILDSRRLQMLDEIEFLRFQTTTRFQPIFSLGDAGIRRYDDAPRVAAIAAAVAPVF